MSGGVVTLGSGVLNCWAKKQTSVALSSWESELFTAITSGTRSLGLQSELMVLGYSCSVTVETNSQSVVDHSKRRGQSVASKHVGLRGVWLQEAPVDGKLDFEKVDTAMNSADVCTKSLLGNITRAVSDCSSVMCATTQRTWVTIPTSGTCVGCMSRAMLCLTGRVDFTSLLCCNQTHFAFSVGHEFINSSFESVS